MKVVETYEINKHKLDREWERQPRMYHEVADKLAEAESEVDYLKAKLELVQARISLLIRKEPSAYGLKKLTESLIEKAVITDDEYQAALGDLNEAKNVARHLQADARYLEHRKSAIEHLSKLRIIDYWADPRIGGEERQKEADRVRREVFEKTRD
jgi:GTP1/Obg family GTP-binding protein